MRYLILLFFAFSVAGCSVTAKLPKLLEQEPLIQENPLIIKLNEIKPIDGPVMTVGVYSFTDKTGQRKPADNIANLSSAVTQGAEVWVIDALLQAGEGTWFEVVERVGMDNVIKERQLIRNTRENYEKEPVQLSPMKFAGLLLEGGIVGFDSNIQTGGQGARYLGIGLSEAYRVDQVTVAMRLVSVQTGEILLTTQVTKTIASHSKGGDVFTFVDMNTKAVELERGVAVNEPVTYAIRTAIEFAVLEIIHLGEEKQYWKFKKDKLGIH